MTHPAELSAPEREQLKDSAKSRKCDVRQHEVANVQISTDLNNDAWQ